MPTVKDQEGLHPLQVEAFRRMTPAQKLQLVDDLYWFARELKASGFRYQHPDWGEDRVQDEVRRVFLNGQS